MVSKEVGDLALHLELVDVGVQVDAVQAVELQGEVTFEDVVDVHHSRAGHGESLSPEGRLCRPDTLSASPGRVGGGWGEGLPCHH
jgi:hypothetical protein